MMKHYLNKIQRAFIAALIITVSFSCLTHGVKEKKFKKGKKHKTTTTHTTSSTKTPSNDPSVEDMIKHSVDHNNKSITHEVIARVLNILSKNVLSESIQIIRNLLEKGYQLQIADTSKNKIKIAFNTYLNSKSLGSSAQYISFTNNHFNYFIKLAAKNLPNVKRMMIYNACNSPDVSGLEIFPNLQKVCFTKFNSIKGFGSLHQCPKLLIINFFECKNLSKEDIEIIKEKSPKVMMCDNNTPLTNQVSLPATTWHTNGGQFCNTQGGGKGSLNAKEKPLNNAIPQIAIELCIHQKQKTVSYAELLTFFGELYVGECLDISLFVKTIKIVSKFLDKGYDLQITYPISKVNIEESGKGYLASGFLGNHIQKITLLGSHFPYFAGIMKTNFPKVEALTIHDLNAEDITGLKDIKSLKQLHFIKSNEIPMSTLKALKGIKRITREKKETIEIWENGKWKTEIELD